MKIFVQLASYRDPQLIPTIEDMLANAKRPKNLVIAIARQYSDEDGFDDLSSYKKDKRFKILDIPHLESKVYVGLEVLFNNIIMVKRILFRLILI